MRLTAAVTREDRWYVARCLEVEVSSQGTSVETALANLKEALELHFQNEPPPDDMQFPTIHEVVIAA